MVNWFSRDCPASESRSRGSSPGPDTKGHDLSILSACLLSIVKRNFPSAMGILLPTFDFQMFPVGSSQEHVSLDQWVETTLHRGGSTGWLPHQNVLNLRADWRVEVIPRWGSHETPSSHLFTDALCSSAASVRLRRSPPWAAAASLFLPAPEEIAHIHNQLAWRIPGLEHICKSTSHHTDGQQTRKISVLYYICLVIKDS